MRVNFSYEPMRWILSLSTLFILIVFFFAKSGQALKCYQCISNDRMPCHERHLRDCPTDQAYDMCSVMLKKQAGELQVTRKCVLGPCTLRDREIHDILQLKQQCDMSQPDFNCIYCCRGDGCNRDSASSNHLHQMAAVLAIFFLFSSRHFRF